MRSIWKGAITFGLVNVPVKVYSATEDHDVELHQVHDADGGRIRYQRRCEVCGNVVDYAHIDKAFTDGDKTVVITDADLKSLPEERSREIDVVEFVPSDQLDPIMFDRSYFLEPDGSSPKAYVLLRRTLEQTDRTAIVHFALRQKTRLAALRVRDGVLMLQTLLWDDEVRVAEFPALEQTVKISDRELDLSAALVDSFAADFTPGDYTDEYQAQLRRLIEEKLEKGDAIDTEATFGKTDEEAGGGEVLDLMEALRRSVDRSRSGGASAKTAGSKTAGSKTAASKQAATKPAAKTAASKKKTTAKADAEPARKKTKKTPTAPPDETTEVRREA
ncbi:Ku protein [Cryobacterium adonitolivorans]|uniref:Non-homologous end joining protein Ku n=1 Tax=Cryobacterium adonitolivorans TaxID=1259189 RepID=A0A4V3ICT1_9MICO|nr:Ku protein [Cryobacterium adonitolivorans]TFC02780.1 Ku protein [Cryobacterium adonitolivorans]